MVINCEETDEEGVKSIYSLDYFETILLDSREIGENVN